MTCQNNVSPSTNLIPYQKYVNVINDVKDNNTLDKRYFVADSSEGAKIPKLKKVQRKTGNTSS